MNTGRGGKREGAGRKPMSEADKVKSVVIRVPESLASQVRALMQGDAPRHEIELQEIKTRHEIELQKIKTHHEIELQKIKLEKPLQEIKDRALEDFSAAILYHLSQSPVVSILELRGKLPWYGRERFNAFLLTMASQERQEINLSCGERPGKELLAGGIQQGPEVVVWCELRRSSAAASMHSSTVAPQAVEDTAPSNRAELLALAKLRHDAGETLDAIAADFNARGWYGAQYRGGGGPAPKAWDGKKLWQAIMRASA